MTIMTLCLVPFLMAFMGMGAFAIHTVLWHISGKEIIEATRQDLIVTRQVFRWKWSKVYSSDRIRNLRIKTHKLSMFLPGRIAFEYGRRTASFGLDLSEEEAEQVLLVVQGGLLQQNAG